MFFKNVASAARRASSTFGSALRKVGSVAGHVVKRVGDFVAENHPAIATVSQALARASGNETLKNIANSVSQASNAYSALQNYHKGTHIRQPNVVTGVPVAVGKSV